MTKIKIKIDKNVPLPVGNKGPKPQGTSLAAQWEPTIAKMSIGDSFMVPKEKTNVWMRNVLTKVLKMKKHKGKKFFVSKSGTGYRCWRTL